MAKTYKNNSLLAIALGVPILDSFSIYLNDKLQKNQQISLSLVLNKIF